MKDKFMQEDWRAADETPPSNDASIVLSYTVSPEEKCRGRGGYVTMAIILLLYAALGTVSGILLKSPSKGAILHKIGICSEENAKAYVMMIALIWIALLPSVGYCFAVLTPFHTPRWLRITLAVLTTLLLIGGVVGYFYAVRLIQIDGIALKEYYEGNDYWYMPASLIAGVVGIGLSYLTVLLTDEDEDFSFGFLEISEGDGCLHTIGSVFVFLLNVFLFVSRCFIWLGGKCPGVMIIIATLLLTVALYFTTFIFGIFSVVTVLAGLIFGVLNR